MSQAVAANPLNALTTVVTQLIAQKETTNSPSSTIATARLLHIAIENAKNIYEQCAPDRQSFIEDKEKEFNEMLACLQKLDFCRLNLLSCIRHSIDSGTSDGWFPKMYDVCPQYVVPKSGFIVRIFGKWKYAAPKTVKTYTPTLTLCGKTFEPVQSNQHTLTFQPTINEAETPFLQNTCAQLTGRLVVPYEVGNLGAIVSNQRRFTFDVLIFSLPINAGIIAISSRLLNNQMSTVEHIMKWEESRVVELISTRDASFVFTSFDGKKQAFTAAELEKSAKPVFPNPFTQQASYLKITQVATTGNDRHKWNVETVPPIGL